MYHRIFERADLVREYGVTRRPALGARRAAGLPPADAQRDLDRYLDVDDDHRGRVARARAGGVRRGRRAAARRAPLPASATASPPPTSTFAALAAAVLVPVALRRAAAAARARCPSRSPARCGRCASTRRAPSRSGFTTRSAHRLRRDDAARAARRRPGRRRDHGPRLRQPQGRARDAVLLRPRLHPRRPRLRAGRDRAWRGGARGLPAARARRAGGPGRGHARRDGAGRRALLRRPDRASCAVVGVTGTSGKTTTAWLMRAMLEAAGMQSGLLGTVASIVGGERAAGGAHDAGGDRPPAHVPRDARRRRRRLRDGDLLARARAAPRRGHPLHGLGLHEPEPGPPRLPPRHGGVLPRQAAAVRDRPGGADRVRRRRLRAAAGRGVPRHGHVRDRRGGRRARARRAARRRGLGLHAAHRRRRVAGAARDAGALQRAERARRVGGGARAGRAAGAAARDAGRAAARAGPLRAGRRGPAVRGRRRLLAQAGGARERAALGARRRRRAA